MTKTRIALEESLENRIMNIFPYHSRLIRRQHYWWQAPEILFSPQYALHIVLFAVFLISIGCLLYIWQWTSYLQLGYRMQALQKEKNTLEQRIALLEIEVNYLTRPERLDQMATTRLNMHLPSPDQRLILNRTVPDASE